MGEGYVGPVGEGVSMRDEDEVHVYMHIPISMVFQVDYYTVMYVPLQIILNSGNSATWNGCYSLFLNANIKISLIKLSTPHNFPALLSS